MPISRTFWRSASTTGWKSSRSLGEHREGARGVADPRLRQGGDRSTLRRIRRGSVEVRHLRGSSTADEVGDRESAPGEDSSDETSKVKIRFTDQAKLDIAAVAYYYEEHREGLGERFERAVIAAEKVIARSPEIYRASFRNRRRIFLRGFPTSSFTGSTKSKSLSEVASTRLEVLRSGRAATWDEQGRARGTFARRAAYFSSPASFRIRSFSSASFASAAFVSIWPSTAMPTYFCVTLRSSLKQGTFQKSRIVSIESANGAL